MSFDLNLNLNLDLDGALDGFDDELNEDNDKPTILLVDDEPPNLDVASKILKKHFKILTASSGKEALTVLAGLPSDQAVEVIVSDQRMPQMTGVELFTELCRQQHPASRIILTGYADLESIMDSVNTAEIYRYLTKPIDANVLSNAVEAGRKKFGIQSDNRRLIAMVKDLIEETGELNKRLAQHGKGENVVQPDSTSRDAPRNLVLAVLFIDLRGFTALSKELGPVGTIEVLQRLHHGIHGIIYDAGGIVDKHLGDGLMAVFGLGGVAGVQSAMAAAEGIVDAAPGLITSIVSANPKAMGLKIGIGVAAGEVVVGVIGSERKQELAVIGEPANLAARLQEFTKIALDTSQVSELESFDNALAICTPEMVGSLSRFKLQELGKVRVRDFVEIDKVGVFRS
jgi:adenylate cyclase